ncbi:hypothetical protein [Caulobacter segnis]|uniref:hypothetical protein n=1 Tax=Caulobacter segnis TaxID=88688 RepID=UPI00286379CD|nr:hypothetical protein [Caulobacter segnis]MDR6625493.1 hypothetical protein [Caulobacter segnis]
MPNPLQLLLPALIPSWNFFDVIAPSPRVEYALTASADARPEAWREFRPRPERLSPGTMAARMLWNPRWNESLFLVSCAERLIDHPTAHGEDEIFRRIAADLARSGEALDGWLAFRLVFVAREDEVITREVLFEAAPRALAEIDVR